MDKLASARTTRLGVGTALALFISQAINWPAAFICPVLVSVLLALPMPRWRAKQLIGFVVVLGVSLLVGVLISPMLIQMPAAGLLMIVLLLFLVFRFAAAGGSAPLANFLSLGIAVLPVFGSASLDFALLLFTALLAGAITAAICVACAYALVPDPVDVAATKPPAPPARDPIESARLASRSTLVVLPLLMIFLTNSGSVAYLAVLIKRMSLGQQACVDSRRSEARSLIKSTVIGGLIALAMWMALKIWPSLLIYTLLTLLAGLWTGQRIFRGAGLGDEGAMWSYAFMTALIVIGPAATAGEGGDPAIGTMLLRIAMMLAASVYAAVAVRVHDYVFPRRVPAPTLATTTSV